MRALSGILRARYKLLTPRTTKYRMLGFLCRSVAQQGAIWMECLKSYYIQIIFAPDCYTSLGLQVIQLLDLADEVLTCRNSHVILAVDGQEIDRWL